MHGNNLYGQRRQIEVRQKEDVHIENRHIEDER